MAAKEKKSIDINEGMVFFIFLLLFLKCHIILTYRLFHFFFFDSLV